MSPVDGGPAIGGQVGASASARRGARLRQFRHPHGPENALPAFSTHASDHFTVRYTALDTATVAETATTLEGHYARITGDLGVTSQPRVTVTLHVDRASLQEAVRPIVGALPSFASGLVTGPDSIHILSPNLTGQWTYATAVTALVHEFAHCVSLTLNPSFGNHPRWLWESVALYEPVSAPMCVRSRWSPQTVHRRSPN